MIYYLVLSVAVTMFGFQFFFNQEYQKIRGASFKAATRFVFGAQAVGALILWAINKFRFEFTPFSFIVALVAATNLICYNVCSIKALGKVNLSMFSVFAMLGGMILPSVAGLVFFDESMTLGKGICMTLTVVALVLTIGKGTKTSGLGYCFGVFVTNGLVGVISKVFSSSSFEKTSDAGYSVLLSIILAVACGAISFAIKKPPMKGDVKALGMSAGYGVLTCVGNLLVLISLNHIPASAQYPFITAGVIIVSTIICCFGKNKPKVNELIAVAVSFVGVLALVLI